MDVSTILKEQFKDLITDDTLKAIEEAFEQAVSEKAATKSADVEKLVAEKLEQRLDIEKEAVKQALVEKYEAKLASALESIDEDHADKLTKLVEAIDTDHTIKLQKLVKEIDQKHAKMLRKVVEKYETALSEKAINFRNSIVEEVSNYLDLYIDKVIPKQQIAEAVENIKARKQLEQIRQLISIDEDFIAEEVKEALKDGKSTIDSLKSELNEVIKENIELKQRAERLEASQLLTEKTKTFSEAKKFFVTKLLKNKSPQYISENFEYVSQMFDKEQEEDVDSAREEIFTESFIKSKKPVDRPEIVEEEVKQPIYSNEIDRTASGEDTVSGYLNEMERLSRFSANKS